MKRRRWHGTRAPCFFNALKSKIQKFMKGAKEVPKGNIAKSYAISDAKIGFVSLVDKAANKHKFLITKSEGDTATIQIYGRIVKADEDKVYWDGDTLCVEFNNNDSGFISLGILQKIISRRIPAHIPFQTKCTCKVSLGLSIETEAWEKRFIQAGLLPDVNMGLGIACDGITVKAAVQAVKTVYPVAGDSGNAGIYPIISTELQTAGGDVLPKVKTESWKVVYPICGDALGI